MNIIPLKSNLSYFSFVINLKKITLKMHISWLTRFLYYSVDIYDAEDKPIALGRALHPGINLLGGLNNEFGKIALIGDQPTITNLGITNELRWYPDE